MARSGPFCVAAWSINLDVRVFHQQRQHAAPVDTTAPCWDAGGLRPVFALRVLGERRVERRRRRGCAQSLEDGTSWFPLAYLAWREWGGLADVGRHTSEMNDAIGRQDPTLLPKWNQITFDYSVPLCSSREIRTNTE